MTRFDNTYFSRAGYIANLIAHGFWTPSHVARLAREWSIPETDVSSIYRSVVAMMRLA